MGKAKRNPWQTELDQATKIAAPFGCLVAASSHDYEIATIKGDGIQLLIYSHTVGSTRNQHARIRDNGSKDKARARRLMVALHNGEGLPKEQADSVRYSCTFSWKNMSMQDVATPQSTDGAAR